MNKSILPTVRICLCVTIVPKHLAWLSLLSKPLAATKISTTKGWCPLEMAKFSEGL